MAEPSSRSQGLAQAETLPRVLWVDDDPQALILARMLLRGVYEMDTAEDGPTALAALVKTPPYTAIVADMAMPGMTGMELLERAHIAAPDTIRLMVTGNPSEQVAIDAINRGAIFRFLTKPIYRAVVLSALSAATVQYRLVAAERELLKDTLTGAVQVLIDVLSQTQPAAFGRANRVRRTSRMLAERMKMTNAWEAEMAAMLSHVGCISVPSATLQRILEGGIVSPEELVLYEGHPKVGARLLSMIPRLAPVAEAIALQDTRFVELPVSGGRSNASSEPDGSGHAQLAASILKVALDFDLLLSRGATAHDAIAKMKTRSGTYNPAVLRQLAEDDANGGSGALTELPVFAIDVGMVLAEDITLDHGAVVLVSGQQVTPVMALRLRKLSESISPNRRFKVLPAAA